MRPAPEGTALVRGTRAIAKELNLSRMTAWRWANAGELPAARVHGRYVMTRDAVTAYLLALAAAQHRASAPVARRSMQVSTHSRQQALTSEVTTHTPGEGGSMPASEDSALLRVGGEKKRATVEIETVVVLP